MDPKRDPTQEDVNRLVIGPHRPNHYLVDTISYASVAISGYYLAITINRKM